MGNQRFILHAPNVHCGGGKVLLDQLIDALYSSNLEVIALLDARYLSAEKINTRFLDIHRFHNTFISRYAAELTLKKTAKKNDIIFCFGNLPPLLCKTGIIYVYMQNRCVFYEKKWRDFHWKVALRLTLEKLWLRLTSHKINKIFIQTETMQKLIQKHFKNPSSISPFYEYRTPQEILAPDIKPYDFIYIASGDTHKNHQPLIEAWVKLANIAVYPKLALTLPEKSRLWTQIQNLCVENPLINIVNLGVRPYEKIHDDYLQSRALIYPAYIESFGLPLLEASYLGLDILAPELDYVRDLVNPIETFDPHSSKSIMRAVLRYLRIQEEKQPIESAHDFIQHLL